MEPFEVVKMVNAAAVHLRLSWSMKVHPTFHVSRVKSIKGLELSPVIDNPSPVWFIDGALAYMVQQIQDVRWRGRG